MWSPRFLAWLRTVQRVPWRLSTTPERRFGSTKSKSAELRNWRNAASSSSSASDMLESYQTNVRNASLNSHQFYSKMPPGPPPRPLHSNRRRSYTRGDDTPPPEADLRP